MSALWVEYRYGIGKLRLWLHSFHKPFTEAREEEARGKWKTCPERRFIRLKSPLIYSGACLNPCRSCGRHQSSPPSAARWCGACPQIDAQFQAAKPRSDVWQGT